MPSFRDLKPARRWTLLLPAVLVLGAVGLVSVPAMRHSLLKSAGWALVAEDTPAKADVIVVSSDALGAGMIEAADLVKAGYATRVAIFDRPVSKIQRELARRGAPAIDLKLFSIELLRRLGVTDVTVIQSVVGTNDEGKVLLKWCAANSIHSMLFVSVSDHSRRTRRVLGRALGEHGIQVMVRYARFSEFDPDTWWQTRGGQRTEIVESQKLLVDILRHPF